MIKKIIFDVDNTLIKWEDEKNWKTAYINIQKQYQIEPEQFAKVKEVINNYELLEDIFNKETMQKMINSALNSQYPIEFLQTILDTFAECVPEQQDIELQKVLQYLSSKYELVVLTNWFGWQQEKRLEKFGIAQYFTKVYGADKFKVKPNKEAFDIAVNTNTPDECIMIGDGIINDVEAAIKSGVQAILYDPNNTEIEQNSNYKIIHNFNELKLIL